MNIAQAHLEALKALGYTEVEARFLYLRCDTFGLLHGPPVPHVCRGLLGKRTLVLEQAPWPAARPHGEFSERWRGPPLFLRRLYRGIQKENLRNRREHEFGFIKRRVAVLDFVLLNQDYQYLETAKAVSTPKRHCH